ncbi:MAG: hypothetical protein HKO71_08625, partial [Pseudomonadales bacterium]|nr:hypothetical protein [Pseudomonadales bacterium]
MIIFKGFRHILPGLLALLVTGFTIPVQAYDVEANTFGNKVYMLLLNDNPGAVYHSI